MVGIGIEPNSALAAAAGIAVDDGILVDEALRTSDPDVFAAADVARFHNPTLGKRIWVEHEDNSNAAGYEAGRAMAGARVAYRHLPFFYSDLFDLGYEAVGDLDSRYEVIADWKVPEREGLVYYVAGGRVRGVLAWASWPGASSVRWTRRARSSRSSGPLARTTLWGACTVGRAAGWLGRGEVAQRYVPG